MTDAPTLSAEDLTKFAADIFVARGFSEDHAAKIAEVLVWADLRGAPSHGVQRIPRYIEIIDDDEMNTAADIRVTKELPAAVLIDADRAPGQVSMRLAAAEAVRKARAAGIGLALVRRTTHTAALGFYTRLAALEGMATIAASASWSNMVYHGAREVGVASNPFSIAIPHGSSSGKGGEPLVLDMATAVAALGKIVHAARSGKSIPEGWALDDDGNPTTDPKKATLPLALGGPKGSGLSLMIEAISSLITANAIIAETIEGTPEGKKHRQNAFLIAIDIAQFRDLPGFDRDLARMIKALKGQPRQAGFEEILMPGERGARELEKRRKAGITIPAATWAELTKVADRFGVKAP
ncbi:MAG TPA: Ldh family oxidoreductase [Stellaceae bacterium]|jgi:ureidoglycolate dehydrogenase (NAD+)|nr:Ldh family oxidoreductase [Stellaceae bacterium]